MSDRIFLKLGGSLITDKASPRTARPAVLARLVNEIAVARAARPDLQLIIGHGSGSFGHNEAKKHRTRQGVNTPAQWVGFASVAAVANQLNRLVVDALRAVGVPVHNCTPSASVVANDGHIESMAVAVIERALAHGLVPLVQGDVAFDRVRGGTIVSTEDVFAYLRRQLVPQRILLAGIEQGVLTHFPDGDLIPSITPANIAAVRTALGGSQATDVTGGMESKVLAMLAQVKSQPGLDILIFNGETAGLVTSALLGEPVTGTRISHD